MSSSAAIEVDALSKVFSLSAKQRKANHTKQRSLVAVNNLSRDACTVGLLPCGGMHPMKQGNA